MTTWVGYAIAIVTYIVIGLFTKRFLTWTWGPIYFVTVLEVLPRVVNRWHHAGAALSPPGTSARSADAADEP